MHTLWYMYIKEYMPYTNLTIEGGGVWVASSVDLYFGMSCRVSNNNKCIAEFYIEYFEVIILHHTLYAPLP